MHAFDQENQCGLLAARKMAITTSMTISGLGLVLILGMRHGLDPDHLAAIDGLTLRTFSARPRWAPWTGGLFAFGHGIVVMGFAFAVSLVPAYLKPSESFFSILEWLPIFLLLILGALNARALLRKAAYRPVGFRSTLLPAYLRDSFGPLSAILVGMVFALVFDTALQAAAWGYAATAIGGTATALLTGLVFTAGMIVTDLMDGWVTSRILLSGRIDAITVFRRRLGWPVVVMCFTIAGYGIVNKIAPVLEISASWYSALGGAMLLFVLGIYAFTLHSMRHD